ncbi:Low-density lipoprotein receptor-related protein 2-like 4, partial [Homarus americanus]
MCCTVFLFMLLLFQNDEDLIFDDEGVVRARREVEVAPVAEPLQDSSNIHSHSGRQRRQLFSNPFGSTSDDEDDEGSAIEGSGMEPRVYRVMFTLEKRWTQAYRNREGPAYRNTKAQISSAFTELLQDVQGNPNLQVVAMTKSPSSEIRLTVDITYDWEPERSNEIKMKIENALRSGFVGSHRVRKQRFSIDEHKALPVPRPRCGPGQHQCLSGRCVARCDGKNECLDASDEKGCPPKHPAEGCRGDDSFLCNDDVTIICEVQRCDGSVDCPDGDDEEGCDPAEGCRGDDSFVCVEGTIICEVQRCDGSEDCPEGDDEEGC